MESLLNYDIYIVCFSGGKDSIACFLYLLELGVPRSKIELWHHEIDGREDTLMDWEVTPAYCKAFAEAFGVPLFCSWKIGGFKGELLRCDTRTAGIIFEDDNYRLVRVGGNNGIPGTRLRFPQISSDLSVRWCSPYLKIGVGDAAIRNQQRFVGKRTLVLSGERGEESAARGRYNILEPDRADLRNGVHYQRYVDRFRPIRDWKETEVWKIIESYHIRVHPAYYLGWGRVSCKFCIFGSCNQFASAYKISPAAGNQLMNYERSFKFTMKRNTSLQQHIDKGTPYTSISPELAKIATSKNYNQEIFMQNWVLPAGAYGECCGPT